MPAGAFQVETDAEAVALVPPNPDGVKAVIAMREMEKLELAKCVDHAKAVHQVWLSGSQARVGEVAKVALQSESEVVKAALRKLIAAIRSSAEVGQVAGLLKLNVLEAEIDLTRQLMTNGCFGTKAYDEATLIARAMLIKKTLWQEFTAALMEERARVEQDVAQLNHLLEQLIK